MLNGSAGHRRRDSLGRVLLAIPLAFGVILNLSSSALAQTPLPSPTTSAPGASPSPALMSGGQGPRSPFVGPASAPPEGEGPPRESSSLPPGRSARCRWDLRGTWESRGRQTDPTATNYTATVSIRQYGNYVIVEKIGEPVLFYGVCSGDRIELDGYSGDQFVGAYTGTVSINGRRIESSWVLYNPERSGYETLSATAPASTR